MTYSKVLFALLCLPATVSLADEPREVPLWPKGAPGFESRRDEPQLGRVPVEAHVFARGGHGFNMGNRSKLATLKSWPQRLADWMADNEILSPPKK